MTRVGASLAAPAATANTGDDPKLRQAARQLTGLFAQQLFKAMRETVPTDQGVVSGGSGEEMFTGMLDEHLAGAGPATGPGGGPAASARAAFTQGLADAVYRRLRTHAAPSTAPSTAPSAASTASPAAVTPAPSPASLTQPAPLLGPIDRR